jgi:hypothetical protein
MNDIRFFRVNIDRLENLAHQIEKLNKRAAKLGVAHIGFNNTQVFDLEPVYEPHGVFGSPRRILYYDKFVWMALSGASPKFAGWTLAAVVEHAEEGNILRKSPDCTAELTKFRSGAPVCQHCNLARNRKDTYIVIHDDGSQKQVGHNCIKDFLGHANPNQLAAWAELCYSACELCEAGEGDSEGGCGGSRNTCINVESFLVYASLALRLKGWVSGKTAFESQGSVTSTKEWALQYMFPPKDAAGRIIPQPAPEQVDIDRAEKSRAFVLETLGTRESESLSDFEHNILMVSKCEAVEGRNVGMIAYVPEYFRRETEKAVLSAKRGEEAKVATHFGEVGKRVKNTQVTYLRSTGFETQYGYCFIHTFVAADGTSRLVWKTSGELPATIQEGVAVTATFTVKEHGDYKGFKQTKISRVKIAGE